VERYYKFKRVARRLGVTERYLRKLQRQGCLRVVRFGRAVRISETEVERLIREGVPR